MEGSAKTARLVGDVGATNARFAWQERADASLTDIASYPGDDHASLEAALRHYLSEHGKKVPRWCSIGIAVPVTSDQVTMTNRPAWSFSIDALRRSLGCDRLLVINDFTALALALPALDAADIRQVGPGTAVAGQPVALIGPGSGLGVSGLIPAGARMVPIAGEGGHVTLPAVDDREAELIAAIRKRFDHVSAERALSGPGLENLYAAICEVDGVEPSALEDAQIVAAALTGTDARCVATVEAFLSLLGNVAGNLALTLGARGGVYIGGGIVPRLGDRIDRSPFRERFEGKGRFKSYLAPIPTFVIVAKKSPALLGAARALDLLD